MDVRHDEYHKQKGKDYKRLNCGAFDDAESKVGADRISNEEVKNNRTL